MNSRFLSARRSANDEAAASAIVGRPCARARSFAGIMFLVLLSCDGVVIERANAQTTARPSPHRLTGGAPQVLLPTTQGTPSASHRPISHRRVHRTQILGPTHHGYAANIHLGQTACDQCGCDSSTLLPTGGCSKCMMGVDCATDCGAEARWSDIRPMPFAPYGPGGYAGPARLPHLDIYRLRPGDQIRLVYLVTRRQGEGSYRLTPGDEVLIESLADESLLRGTLERGLQVQPDGTITVRLLGEVQAAGLTVGQLRQMLDKEYEQFYEEPSIDVTPVRTNTLAEDIRSAVAGQGGFNPQNFDATVMPDGNLRLPGLGSLQVQGFSLDQLKREVNLRYGEIVVGLEVEPILVEQAPHFVTVLGQVNLPNRIQINTPTTVLGAIAAAGGHLPGGNLRQVVVFRRAEDWRLVSTVLDLNGAVLGKRPTPADEIWVQDGDVIIVPDKPIQIFDNWVRQVFTEGIYGVVPFGGISFSVQENN